MSRTVTVLLTYEDQEYGAIGPFPVDSPWWADVEPVVAHVSAVVGVPVVVLRLVDVVGGTPPRDGHVLYHAEALDRPQLRLGRVANGAFLGDGVRVGAGSGVGGTGRGARASFDELAVPEPRRASYATAGGVRAALAWADETAERAGYRRIGPPEQIKTWNLSAVFRLPVAGGEPLWLKLTRDFAAHEPAVTALVSQVDASLVPVVVGSDPAARRVLYAHIPGEDCWDASPELLALTVDRWSTAQAKLATAQIPILTTDPLRTPSRAPQLAGAAARPLLTNAPGPALLPGLVPDRRPDKLAADLAALLEGAVDAQLSAPEREAAQALAAQLPTFVSALTACGLPETLVHGDFHPGNWRAGPTSASEPVLLDFADAYIGHPAFDGVRLRDFLAPPRRAAVTDAWCEAWAARVPDSDPARALALATPLQHIAGTVLYAMFLDNIETSERRYHEDDPAAEIRAAIVGWYGLDRAVWTTDKR